MGIFFSAIAYCLMALNMLAGIIGGVWLGILGEWTLLGMGIGYSFLSVLLISILLLPSLLFAGLADVGIKNGISPLTYLGISLSQLWLATLMIGSAFVILQISLEHKNDHPIWPFLLISYATAISPWVFLAQKDAQAGNNRSSFLLYFFQLSMISMSIGGLLYDSWDAEFLLLCAAPLLFIGIVFQILSVKADSQYNQY